MQPNSPAINGENQASTFSGQLKFLYCNARSLNNKFDFLAATAELYDPHFIGVSESWLQEHIDNAEITLRGYELFRNDRQNGQRGGGVLLYVKSELHPIEYKPISKVSRTSLVHYQG